MKGGAMGLLRAAPGYLWTFLAGAVVLAIALVRAFFYGKATAKVGAKDTAERADVKAMRKATAAGDDAEAQRLAFKGIKPGKGKR